ncbi:MAG: Tryptophanyl-tRNA synthetase [Parcubacteria group bacterium GW2011_GWB1_43_6]|nr:MAG: Tryptophanyl-tRNA synthetase [Parcubacteria group bacterium GW2011_GWB1_43_6]
MSETVLSGIRATGRLHFGNFLGAVQNFVRFQQNGNTCLYFVADWHTLTTLDDPEELRRNLLEIVTDYLAAGLDPEKSVIYAQSSVPEIAELALYLSMLQPLGELQTIPTFKELVRKFPEMVSLGLITYPVLMAADILGPRATLVPVGEDQVPNVELARNLAKRFNNRLISICRWRKSASVTAQRA